MAKEDDDAFAKIDALIAEDKGKSAEVVGDEIVHVEDDIESGIQSLRSQLDAANNARIEAERRAMEATAKVNRATSEVDDTNMRLINSAIETTRQEALSLKAQYRDALAIGDFDRVADINLAMIVADRNLSQLENGKAAFESRPKQQAQIPLPSDPVERFAAQLSPKSAQWIRQHPEFVTDPSLQREMFKAHEASERNGIAPDSPAYFNFVEKWLNVDATQQRSQGRQIDDSSAFSEAAVAPKKQGYPATVPVSRTNSAGITNTTAVSLTAEEREIAEMNGLSPKEYLQNKIALQKDGRIGRRNYN